MIHELIPWRTLTRTEIPPLKVSRRPLEGVQVGETFDPELFPLAIRKERLRQFYEQRRLEPVNPPVNSRQYWREQRERVGIPVREIPVVPIVPVSSQIVAALPALAVAESADLDRSARPRGRGRPKGSLDKSKRRHRSKKKPQHREPQT